MSRMTSIKLIMLRSYCLTVGRFAWGGKLLRRMLLFLLITSRERSVRYNASSRFFDMRELE